MSACLVALATLGWIMDLRTRLQRMNLRRDAPATPSELSPRPAQPPLESLVEGQWVVSSGSRCFVAERLYPLEHFCGGLRLLDLLTLRPQEWMPLGMSGDSPSFDPGNAAFIDIETTGLARGAGTYAFLVGLGFFVSQGFLVRQYFMPDYADEDMLLDLVARDLAGKTGLISFNGRSFDWPIIETRYVLARREPPCRDTPHLDLLLFSRRLWRRVLPSCALSSLERSVLGIDRDDIDVPSYLIPQMYQDYVRRGLTQPLVGVFYHNEMDLISMVALATWVARVVSSPFGQEHASLCDHLALGRLYESGGRTGEALLAYQVAAQRGRGRWEIDAACKRLSFLLKRLGRYDEAMEVWRRKMDGAEVYPYVELAKQLEHRLHDYAGARRVTLQATDWVQRNAGRLGASRRRRLMAELRHRLARVERLMARTGTQAETTTEVT